MTDHVTHSPEPAAPGGDVAATPQDDIAHDHPLPLWMRLGFASYGVLLGLFGGAVLFDIVQEKQRDREVTATIYAELDRRTAERKKQEALVQRQLTAQEAASDRQSEGTRLAVCALLANDFEPSPTVVSVGTALRCTPPITLTP